ncbi:MAG: tRNA 2-thiocytidine biosynthesis protein TtcA [Treponema sp.]|nr:tRNA 2-thiocytidine biosynthesis protein TtcA [Candidatus Treponema equifaecale]
MPQPKVFSIIDKAVYDYNMIQPGAKILIGASGGKDSTLLAQYFGMRLRRLRASESSFKHNRKENDFTIEAVYIRTDFAEEFNPDLAKLFEEWEIPLKTVFVNTLERVQPGHKMSCYWCSNQRRKELISYAMANGFDTILLGHHLDDVLETLIMNMTRKGHLQAMPPVLQYEKYPLKLVRPLYYVPVDLIVEHADSEGWKKITCTCSYQDNSGRKEAREKLKVLTDGEYYQKKLLLESLRNIDYDYLP